MNIDNLTDIEKRVLIHEALGINCPVLRESLAEFKDRDGYPDAIFQLGRVPDYLNSVDSAMQICDYVKERWDVIIRRHNAGQRKVEFTEPSHEVTASHESLSRAIGEAFLLTLP